MAAPSTELSLTHAKAKFFEVTGAERMVQLEHQKLLAAHIDDCIEKGKREAHYVVPEILTGPFPTFDVTEITLWLLKKCRRGGLQAKLMAVQPSYVICVYGWAADDWLEQDRPTTTEILMPRKQLQISVAPKPPAAKGMFLPPPQSRPRAKAPKMTTEQASAMAQRGELSNRLQYTAQRIKNNR